LPALNRLTGTKGWCVILLLMAGGSWEASSAQVAGAAALPRLTKIQQIRDLSTDEANRDYPVELEAVITFINPAQATLFIQDETAGIFVATERRNDLRRGMAVRLTGKTDGGGFTPIVRPESLTAIKEVPLPPPLPANLAGVRSGALDCEWVEVEGQVRSAQQLGGLRGLKLALNEGTIQCWFKNTAGLELDSLIGADVRVRGVCAGAFGERSELFDFDVFATDMTDLMTLKPASSTGNDIPTRTLKRLLPYSRLDKAGRVRVRGQVTLHWPGRFLFIQDATGAAELQSDEAIEFRPGDEVEAVGFPILRHRKVVMEDCQLKKLGGGATPVPLKRTATEIYAENSHAKFLTVEGKLVDLSVQPRIRATGWSPTVIESTPLLVLSMSNWIFRAELPYDVTLDELSAFEPGSHLALTGVCVGDPVEAGMLRTYRLLLDSTKDIVVLQGAPWWTPKRFFAAVGGSALAALAVMGWAVGFTQRRRRQAETLIKRRNEQTIRLQTELLRLTGPQARDVAGIFRHVTETVADALEVERVSVWQFREDEGRLRCADLFLRSTREHAVAPDLAAADFPGYFAALQEARGIAVGNARTDPRTREFAEAYLKPLNIHSMLDVPVRLRGRIVAVLCLEQTGAPREWTLEEHGFAAGVADQLSIHLEERERLRAEEAMRKSEEKFARAFGSSPDAVVITRLHDGLVIDSNEGCTRIYGYSKSELASIRAAETVWKPGHRERFVALLQKQGFVREFEAVHRRKNGEFFPAQISSEAIEIDGERCLVSVVRDLTERKRAETERQQLLVQLMQAEDEERGRIARELHDTTAQHLAAVSMNLTRLAGDAPGLTAQSGKLVSESLSLADQAVQEIRTLTYLLHPPLLDELGLAGALRDYAAGFTKRSGLHIDVDVGDFSGRLPHEIELALFRVVQESLANVHRHSGSATALLRLERDEHEVRLEIQDNGHGLSPDARRGVVGVGIAGMRERLGQLGGELEVESDGEGVTVLASVPLEPSPKISP